MHHFIFRLFLILFFVYPTFSCQEKSEVRIGKQDISKGNRNEVLIVLEDSLWNGRVGDSLRKILAAPIMGQYNQEPVFDLLQYDPSLFSTKARKARNILIFSDREAPEFTLERSVYASPQNIFTIKNRSGKELVTIFQKYADSIVGVIRNLEMNEVEHELARAEKLDTENIKELFAMTIKIPDSYRLIEQSSKHFAWYQKPFEAGDINLVIYEIPIDQVLRCQGNFEEKIIVAKDSITSYYMKGSRPYSYLITDVTSKPSVYETMHQDFFAWEIEGNWDMQNDFMKGPFLSYIIKDDYYSRYVFVEGYVNNPFRNKRDILMEIEAIMNTINFYTTE